MNEFDELYKRFLAPIGLALAAIVFAFAPFMLYVMRGEEMTRRTLVAQSVQAIWLLFANILCGLLSFGYCVERFGYGQGVAVAIVLTGFGGSIALGLFEIVFAQRRKIGAALAKKSLSILTPAEEKEERND
jgi:hypothetical protein